MNANKVRAAMDALSAVHIARAGEVNKAITQGFPKWNQGDLVDGPVQEFYFRVGGISSFATFGTEDLERYADGDPRQIEALNNYIRHLCGNP
jgi:hypothetical protein